MVQTQSSTGFSTHGFEEQAWVNPTIKNMYAVASGPINLWRIGIRFDFGPKGTKIQCRYTRLMVIS